jgi:cytochrome c oxidase assembly factor CtaG
VAGRFLASGYTGPPPLTPAGALTSWQLDLPVLLAVLILAGLYLAGARRAGQSWPPGRTVAFLAGGLGTLVLATMGFPGVYDGVLFWARAVQTVLLLLVVPLFLAMGGPLSLISAAVPGTGGRIETVLHTRVARALTFPAVTALVLVVTPFVFYFTSWYEAGLRSGAVADLTHLILILPGLVFFWTLLRVDPVPRAYPYLVALWVTGVEVVSDAILGLAVLADEHLIAGGFYQALARPWGPSLRTDQVLGGGALWILGDLVGLPFLAAQFIQMLREDDREAIRVDAELDAAEQAGAERAAVGKVGADQAGRATVTPGVGIAEDPQASTGQTAAAAPSGPDQSVRPWWETDPRFTGRFRR